MPTIISKDELLEMAGNESGPTSWLAKILDVTEKSPGRLLVRAAATVEIRGEEKPGLVAETLVMYVVG